MPQIAEEVESDRVVVALKKLNKRLKEMTSKEIVAMLDSCGEKPSDELVASYAPLERAIMGRPKNFQKLSAREQWECDKKLGLLDWGK